MRSVFSHELGMEFRRTDGSPSVSFFPSSSPAQSLFIYFTLFPPISMSLKPDCVLCNYYVQTQECGKLLLWPLTSQACQECNRTHVKDYLNSANILLNLCVMNESHHGLFVHHILQIALALLSQYNCIF